MEGRCNNAIRIDRDPFQNYNRRNPNRLGIRLPALAEEHGILALDPSDPGLKAGDKIELIVSHARTTINLHDRYFSMRNGSLQARGPIAARGAFHL